METSPVVFPPSSRMKRFKEDPLICYVAIQSRLPHLKRKSLTHINAHFHGKPWIHFLLLIGLGPDRQINHF